MKNKIRFVKMKQSTDIPLNLHFIEKTFLLGANKCYETFMIDYAGHGRLRTCYKANSNIVNFNSNENR